MTINGALLGGGVNGTTVDATQVLTVTGGTAAVQGTFTNNGAVVVQPGATLAFQNLVNGAGSYSGTGTVSFHAGWSPGNSPAAVSVENVLLGSFNTLTMELGGADPGTGYDTITVSVSGDLTLGGTLNVVTIGGFVPQAGQSFDLFDGTTSGTFSNVLLPSLSDGLEWDTSQLYTIGVLSVVPIPEPAAVVLLALAGLALPALRRSARRTGA